MLTRLSILAPLAALLLASSAGAQTPPIIVGPAGSYTVQTPGATKVEYGDGWIRITWANDPAPNPPGPNPPTPEPPPVPPPPPAPVATGKLFVWMAFDKSTDTQETAQARADVALAATELAALDATFRAAEASDDVFARLNLKDAISGKAKPVVVIQEQKPGEQTAAVVKTLEGVTTKAQVIDALKSLRGTK
jgi:hypothetical protein